MVAAVIELTGVGMNFGSHILLKNIGLKVNKGQCFSIVGPSGEGKTVLLKIIAGLLPPTQGEVLVESQNLYDISELEHQKIQLKMGMLFQKNALFDSLSAGENIAFPLREVTSLSEQEIAKKVDFYLEAVGLSSAKDRLPDELSGGMQKRLGIARALALQPEIILYDDPTAGLDPITSRKIIDLIMRLQKEQGATVVAVTNDMNRAYQMADSIGMLVQSELIVTGGKEETLAHPDPRVHQFIRGELTGPLMSI